MAADFQLLATVHLDSFRYDLQLAFGTLGKGIFIKAEEQGQGIAALGIFYNGDKDVVSRYISARRFSLRASSLVSSSAVGE